MEEIRHRFVETNGIKMHIAEQGKGQLVILCHGFPELWYSWRHQIPVLAGNDECPGRTPGTRSVLGTGPTGRVHQR